MRFSAPADTFTAESRPVGAGKTGILPRQICASLGSLYTREPAFYLRSQVNREQFQRAQAHEFEILFARTPNYSLLILHHSLFIGRLSLRLGSLYRTLRQCTESIFMSIFIGSIYGEVYIFFGRKHCFCEQINQNSANYARK